MGPGFAHPLKKGSDLKLEFTRVSLGILFGFISLVLKDLSILSFWILGKEIALSPRRGLS